MITQVTDIPNMALDSNQHNAFIFFKSLCPIN